MRELRVYVRSCPKWCTQWKVLFSEVAGHYIYSQFNHLNESIKMSKDNVLIAGFLFVHL